MKRFLSLLLFALAFAFLAGCGADSGTPTRPDDGGPNTSPTADLTHSPSDPATGETVTFDASGSSDPDGSIVEYRWDFEGDGSVDQTTSDATVDASYSETGMFDATVTVEDDGGATDQATTTVEVMGAALREWVGGDDSAPADFHTAANWSPEGVPDADDETVIPAAPADQPVVDEDATIAKLRVEGGQVRVHGAKLLITGF